jgi:cytidine deaminase
VLSVLLVEKDNLDENGEKIINLYDGTNMEVSMPTGSLCAERNAIGSALSEDLSLKRTELKVMVCVDSIKM